MYIRAHSNKKNTENKNHSKTCLRTDPIPPGSMLLRILLKSSNFTGPAEELTSLIASAAKPGLTKFPALYQINVSHINQSETKIQQEKLDQPYRTPFSIAGRYKGRTAYLDEMSSSTISSES